jgi:hypothetical protein
MVVTALPASSATPAPAGASAGAGATAPAPAAVTPTVTDTAVPPLSSASAKQATARLDVAAPDDLHGEGRLVAHVRKDRVAPFQMYGVTWDVGSATGDVAVMVRTESAAGWSEWAELHAHSDADEAAADGSAYKDGTDPTWVGDASGFEVAVFATGKAPSGVAVSAIDPGSDPVTAKSGGSEPAVTVGKAGTFVDMPRVIRRKSWGADESLGDECWDPKYGRTFKAVVVHHTAGSNDYSKRESKAVVRGVYAYHTQSRGWCDIGYNFLVDRFGRVYEGRDGGVRRPVRGAHAGDYNVDTTGISLMGNFDVARPTQRMKNALVRLTAWRLGTAYHTAYGRPKIYDMRISRISGHRDVMSTACPGRYVYAWLPALRKRVDARIGGYQSPIAKAYLKSAVRKKALGPVSVGERQSTRGDFTMFRRGAMFSSRGNGTRVLPKGPVLSRYRQVGMGSGELGFPRSGLLSVRGTAGKRAMFASGRIYWSPKAGAHDLRSGKILRRYAAAGAAAGRLGFPRSSIFAVPGGSRARFQHGVISFSKATGRTTVELR